MLRRTRLAALSAAAFSVLSSAASYRADAVYRTWAGPGTDWTVGTNWIGQWVPADTYAFNSELAIFNGTSGTSSDPVLTANRSISAFWFQNTNRTISSTGGAAFTVGAAESLALTFSLRVDGVSAVNMAAPVVAGLNYVNLYAKDTTSALTLSGGLSGSGALNVNGAGSVSFTSPATWTGSVNVTGGGSLSLSPNQAITGPYNITNGSLRITDASAVGTSDITLGSNTGNSSAGNGNLYVTSASPVTLSNKITALSTYTGGYLYGGGGINNYTPSLTLAGPIQIGNAGSTSIARLGIDGPGNTTISGTITANAGAQYTNSGSGIIKYGTGTLTITGNNNSSWGTVAEGNYNFGDLLVQQGTVQFRNGNAIGDNSAIHVYAGATLDLGGDNETIGSLSNNTGPGAAVTLGSGTLTFNGGIQASFDGVISGTGGVTATGSTRQTLSAVNTYTGATTFTNGTLIAGVDVPRTGPGAFGNSASTSLTVGNAGTTSRALVGASNATVAKDIIFTAGPDGSRGLYGEGSHSAFTGDLQLAGNAITLYGGQGNSDPEAFLSVSGHLNGAGGLRIDGGGFVLLTGNAAPEVSTRDIEIISGALYVDQNVAAGAAPIKLGTAASEWYIDPGLVTRGNVNVARDIIVGDADAYIGGNTDHNSTFSGAINAGNNVLHLISSTSAGKAVTISGAISGSSYVLKQGSGTVVLANASNSMKQGVEIDQGTLQISADGNLGAAPATRDSDNIYFGGYSPDDAALRTVGSFTLNTNRGIAVGGDIARLDITDGTVSYGGVIAGSSVTVTKSGNGTLSLGGASTFTGGFVARGGTVLVNAAVPASGTGTSANSPLGRQTVTLGDASSTSADAPKLLMNGAFNFSRAITLAAATGVTATVGNNTDDNVAFSANLALARPLNISSAATSAGKALTFSGVISGAQPLALTGTGTTVLSGANTFTNKININSGTLQVATFGNVNGAASNLGRQTTVANATVNLGNATLKYTGAAASTNRPIALTASGATLDSSGAGAGLTLTAATAVSGSGTNFTLAGSTGGTVSGTVSLGAGSLTKSGTGSWTLAAANAYTGGTTVNAGTLTATANNALGNGAVTVNGGALNLGNTSHAISTLNLNGGTVSSTATLTPAAVVATGGTLNAVVGGTGSFTKSGTGSFTLTTANTYSGNTTVQQGTLVVGAGGSFNNSPKITVNSNATLDVSAKGTSGLTVNAAQMLLGSGSVLGNLTVNGNLSGNVNVSGAIGGSGSVNPGNSPGILTASSVNPAGGLDFSFEFTQTGSPNYANAAASGNDVLRLTNSTPFSSALTTANVIDLYLPTLTTNGTFRGGFYTDAGLNFLSSIQNATIHYFTLDPNGTTTYNGLKYSAVDTAKWTLALSTVSDAAMFNGVTTTNGFVTQISAMAAVPLPSAAAMGLAVLPAAALYRRLRRR